jgi:hypothetical protein
VPLASQVSDWMPQDAHTAPAGAHWLEVVGVMQLPPRVAVQQPLGQTVESQLQPPAAQCRPAVQAALPLAVLVLHWQTPVVVLQLSVVPLVVQLLHAAPLMPQAVADWETHVAPLQQPVGQVEALQTQVPALPVPLHCEPVRHGFAVPHLQTPATHWLLEVALQATQAPPLVPQAPIAFALQVPPVVAVQQPVAQLDALHWQVALLPLPTHCWPPALLWLRVQAPAVPHEQTPLVHRLAVVELQPPQSAPPAPQLVVDWFA